MRVEQVPLSVLVLEDDQTLVKALSEYLGGEGWEVDSAASAKEARAKLGQRIFDLVLTDFLSPEEGGLEILEEITVRSPLTKIMLMTGVQDMEMAVRAFRRGASDLISKPFEISQLRLRIDRLMERQSPATSRTNGASRSKKRASKKSVSGFFPNMVGESAPMQRVFRLIQMVGDKNITVLLCGESGTGKELAARAIHEQSGRRDFVAINCGAIPEHLLEDELFGHVQGAYTDAKRSRIGKLEQAAGGTLFLDEVGEMPLSLQVKLLRVLEEREFQKLGSNQTVSVDVRFVAATNADLKSKVKSGEFRADLYYRLNVVPIQMPHLRTIREDIPIMVNFLLGRICREAEIEPKAISPESLKRLMEYDFPGNVRELHNILELACVLSEDSPVLEAERFPTLKNTLEENGAVDLVTPQIELPQDGIDLNQVVSAVEKNLICQSLDRTGGNKGRAARLLNLKRTTLVEKLRRMNLLEQFSR